MKILIMGILSISLFSSKAQTIINKSFPIKPGQKIDFVFDYPNKIKVSTWERNEVSITGKVSINDGENDSAFIVEQQNNNGNIQIKNNILGFADLPKRYIINENGIKKVFRTKEAFNEYRTNTTLKNYYSSQTDIDIQLEIKVPANTETTINAIYGIVELIDFDGPINLNAKYGGIDATIKSTTVGKLTATTSYGQIFSNLKLQPTSLTDKNFFTSFTAEPGKGPAYQLTSTYGNVYLRKSN